jgi:UPF0176 protein
LEEFYPSLRKTLLTSFGSINAFGRVYLCRDEGINGYVSVPHVHVDQFRHSLLSSAAQFQGIKLNEAVDKGRKFTRLHVRWRDSLVSVGAAREPGLERLQQGSGAQRLSPAEWNAALEEPETVLIDARNHYEYEVGRMEKEETAMVGVGAETFRDQVEDVVQQLHSAKAENKQILMFCTSGIRCEKLSVILEDEGFSNLSQLEGGVTEYVRTARETNTPIKFRGKLFSFDEKLGQQITPEHLGRCGVCGTATSSHWNCSYVPCHKLHVQCEDCHTRLHGACSPACAIDVGKTVATFV